MSNALLIPLFEHKAWANLELIKALTSAARDDEARLSAVLTLVDHFQRVDQVFKARLAGEREDLASVVADAPPPLNEIATRMANTDAWYLAYAEQVSDDELARVVEFTFTDGDPGRMTKAEILAHVITHSASHRGQIGKMLERLKVPGAPDMVTTFVSTSRKAASDHGPAAV